MVVSAWNKSAWVKIGASSVAAPASVPGAGVGDAFPALGASAVVKAAPPAPADPAAFKSCGKPCARLRSCGHTCTRTCHAISVPDECKDGLEYKQPAPECDATSCAQPVQVACPCGRKSQKLRCSEARSAPVLTGLCECDEVCRTHAQGRRFHDALAAFPTEDPDAAGDLQPVTMLPFSRALLLLLSGNTQHGLLSEAHFLRKTEQAIRKFALDLAATIDRAEARSCAPTPSASKPSPRTPSQPPLVPVRHLFLSGLTPSRRVLVAEIALWHNLHFNQDAGSIEAIPPLGGDGWKAPPAVVARTNTANDQTNSDEHKEAEKKEQDSTSEFDVACLLPSNPTPPSFHLPSLSLTAAADLYRQSSHLSTLCTAESWPASARFTLRFESSLAGSRTEDPTPDVQRWIAPFADESRASWTDGRTLVVMFAHALTALRCAEYILATHGSELEGMGVCLDPPGPSTLAPVRALAARIAAQRGAERTEAALERKKHEQQFAALKASEARQRALRPPPSASILPPTLTKKDAVQAVRSKLVGHTKLQVTDSNRWATLMDEEEE